MVNSPSRYVWAVSAQPWPDGSALQLAEKFSALGFDGAEIPVRDGFAVTPSNVVQALPEWSKTFADHGLAITSLTGEPTQQLFDLCAELGIPVIRTMAMLVGDDYPAAVAQLQERVVEWATIGAGSGVRIAWQQHHGHFVSTTSGLASFLAPLPQDTVGAAWDAGHSGLAGEEVDLAVSEIRDRLIMVNLRNAHYLGKSDGWGATWVPGPEGMSDWALVGAAVRGAGFDGTICLAAQYSNPDPDITTVIGRDLEFARSVFES